MLTLWTRLWTLLGQAAALPPHFEEPDAIVIPSRDHNASPPAPNTTSGKIPELVLITSPTGCSHRAMWMRANPDAAVRLFNDTEAAALVDRALRDAAAPIARLFNNLTKPVEKADVWRYVAIHRYGGVYSDDDVSPQVPLNRWLATYSWPKVLPRTLVVGIEFPHLIMNGELPFQIVQWTFAATAPRHPLLTAVLQEVAHRVATIPQAQEKVLERTGPVVWTAALLEQVKAHGEEPLEATEKIDERGQLIHLKLPHEGGERWKLLILPYRAFGYHPQHTDVNKGETWEQLVRHEFRGSWQQVDVAEQEAAVAAAAAARRSVLLYSAGNEPPPAWQEFGEACPTEAESDEHNHAMGPWWRRAYTAER